MAVPSSGTSNLSLFKIAKELEVVSNLGYDNTMPYSIYRDSINGATPVSLTNMSTGSGGFDSINTANDSADRPNGLSPHSMSEFYSYDHDASELTQIGSTYSGNYSSSSWQNVSIAVSAYKGKSVRFVFHYVSGSSYTGDLQIDNIAIPYYPFYWSQLTYNLGTSSLDADIVETNSNDTSDYSSVSFTSVGTNTSNYGRFVGRSGGTPSSSTGLSSGYGGSGYYVYAETSGQGSGYPSKNFWLRTDPVILANQVGTPYFGFKLGRYGATIGTLKVYVDEV